MTEIKMGEEVTISYTGQEGYTNQRLMSQYGFVIRGGNPADRIILETSGQTLQLERLQLLMGDAAFLAAISGEDLYSYSALKSLPLVDENVDGGATTRTAEQDAKVAAAFLTQVNIMIMAFRTTLEEDEASFKEMTNVSDFRDVAVVVYRIERKRLLRRLRDILSLLI